MLPRTSSSEANTLESSLISPDAKKSGEALVMKLNQEVLASREERAVEAFPSSLDLKKFHLWGFDVKISCPLKGHDRTGKAHRLQVVRSAKSVHRLLQDSGWICIIRRAFPMSGSSSVAEYEISIAEDFEGKPCIECADCSFSILEQQEREIAVPTVEKECCTRSKVPRYR